MALDPNTVAFLARLATQPNAARIAAYDALITLLDYSGVWAKLDGLYCLAAADSPTSLTNLIQASFGASAVGPMTFTVDVGYAGDNTVNSYLETGFDPTVGTPNYSQNSASLGGWKSNTPAGDSGMIAAMSDESSLVQAYAIDGHFYYQVTGNGADSAGLASQLGVFSAARGSSTAITEYIQGAPVTGLLRNSSALTAGKTMRFCGDGTQGGESNIAIAYFGGNLTAEDHRNVYAAFQGYITALAGGTTNPVLNFSSDIINDGNNNYTPGIARLDDGRLFSVYCVGSGGAQDNGVLTYRLASDAGNAGKTWGAAVTIASPSAGNTYANSKVIVWNGKIIVNCDFNPNGSATSQPCTFVGTVAGDLSISWSAQNNIGGSISGGTGGAALALSGSQLMIPVYDGSGNVSGWFSSDAVTWGNQTAIASNGSGVNFSESSFIQFASGTIFGVLRNDGANSGYYSVSTADPTGLTGWGSLTQIFTGVQASAPGGPTLQILPSGHLFFMGRFVGPGSADKTGYSWSTDGAGAVWSAPSIYFNPVSSLGFGSYVYAQGFFDPATYTLMYAIGQGDFSAAQIIFQQFQWDARPLPVANFSMAPTSGNVPLNVVGQDLSTGSPTSWLWNFGDGGTSTLQNPPHTYTSIGAFTVSLTATNAAGSNTLTETGYITVASGLPGLNQTPSGSWGGGPPGLRVSSLTRTRDFPGMRKIIEEDDERIVQDLMEELTKGTVH